MTPANSLLRQVDARTKLALAAAVSGAVMLPLPSLAVLAVAFAALIGTTGLTAPATTQLRRLAVPLAILFGLDWAVVSFSFAILITLRLALLATAGTVLVATTTPDEIRVALERLGLSRRLAFTLANASRSVDGLQREWQTVVEAQRARGIDFPPRDRRDWRGRLAAAVALIVPAVVLATQRAWHLSEAAAVRGLESPRQRRPDPRPLGVLDRTLLAGTAGLLFALTIWR